MCQVGWKSEPATAPWDSKGMTRPARFSPESPHLFWVSPCPQKLRRSQQHLPTQFLPRSPLGVGSVHHTLLPSCPVLACLSRLRGSGNQMR